MTPRHARRSPASGPARSNYIAGNWGVAAGHATCMSLNLGDTLNGWTLPFAFPRQPACDPARLECDLPPPPPLGTGGRQRQRTATQPGLEPHAHRHSVHRPSASTARSPAPPTTAQTVFSSTARRAPGPTSPNGALPRPASGSSFTPRRDTSLSRDRRRPDGTVPSVLPSPVTTFDRPRTVSRTNPHLAPRVWPGTTFSRAGHRQRGHGHQFRASCHRDTDTGPSIGGRTGGEQRPEGGSRDRRGQLFRTAVRMSRLATAPPPATPTSPCPPAPACPHLGQLETPSRM